MIRFNVPISLGKERRYIKQSLQNGRKPYRGLSFTQKCEEHFSRSMKAEKVSLTTSCTHALEMAAMLLDVKEGDEIIMPSYTYVSTANAFALRGAKIVFVDIRPDTMNIDERLIEQAVTAKTKAIVPVHYSGVACEMDAIMAIAKKHNLYVIEDAAHGIEAKYKGRALGTIGDIGCLSFHETKNFSMGEGGAIVINNKKFIERCEIIKNKGTDKTAFLQGKKDKYTWVDIGSSYTPCDIGAARLYAQLQVDEKISADRLRAWNLYDELLKPLAQSGVVQAPYIPDMCEHNGHIYYIKCAGIEQRTALIAHLKSEGISSVFHYIPLHTSKAGLKYGRFCGEDKHTTAESKKILRLPMYYGIKAKDIKKVCKEIARFYESLKNT